MAEFYRLAASDALRLIRQGKLTVEDYAKSLLSRINERDHIIHAWAYLDSDLVISQARRLDAIPPESRGPLHGLPIGIKDIALTKDMPTRYNSAIYKDEYSSSVDASVVIALRAAGALIFGKTATVEFATVAEGGPCTNPHNPQHTPGGSSSGSGAAVADFQIPVALGTQTGGSIIRPGSFNGVYGLKPTWGAIAWNGLSHWSVTCDTIGFFARCVEDLEILASVFDLADEKPIPQSPSVSGLRIAFAHTHVWPKAGPGLKAAWKDAMMLLTRHGAEIEEIELPDDFAKLADWHGTVVAGEGRAAFLGNYMLAKDKLTEVAVNFVENKENVSRKALLESFDGSARLRPAWDELSSQYDAVIVPSSVDEAPRGLKYTGDASFCTMWTLLHAPALNVPGFAGENDLPIGLTVVGPRYRDFHVLDVGKRIGRIFGAEGGFVLSQHHSHCYPLARQDVMLEEIDGKPQEFPKTIYFYAFFTASRTWVLLINGAADYYFLKNGAQLDYCTEGQGFKVDGNCYQLAHPGDSCIRSYGYSKIVGSDVHSDITSYGIDIPTMIRSSEACQQKTGVYYGHPQEGIGPIRHKDDIPACFFNVPVLNINDDPSDAPEGGAPKWDSPCALPTKDDDTKVGDYVPETMESWFSAESQICNCYHNFPGWGCAKRGEDTRCP